MTDAGEVWTILRTVADDACLETIEDALGMLKSQEEVAFSEANDSLQPWLTVLELGIVWLFYLHMAIDPMAASSMKRSVSRECLGPGALVGYTATIAVAIRRLCLSGLDGASKALLRILSEGLTCCTAIALERDSRQDFVDAQGFEEARKIWSQRFAGRKVAEVLRRVEEEILSLDEEARSDIRASRGEERQMASQFVHPSYPASRLATYPPSSKDRSTFKLGILGLCSITSKRTLRSASFEIWYFAHTGYIVLQGAGGRSERLYQPSQGDGLDWMVESTREAFVQLFNRFYSKDGGNEELTPWL